MKIPVKQDQSIKVFIMDLLCQTPFYDRYLCEHFRAINPQTTLGSITFHLDTGYFKRHGWQNNPGLLDIVAKLSIHNKYLRRGLKALEYMVNLLAISVRFTISKPDIIHIEWVPFIIKVPFELWFLKMVKKQGIKLVYTVHNVLPHDTGEQHKEAYSKVYNIVDALICHTHSTKNQLITEFAISPEKIWVIPHGPLFYDGDQITYTEARSQLGYYDKQTIVLFFGIIRPYKGVEFLLQAWEKVVRRFTDTLLVLAGNGDSSYLQKITEIIKYLGLEDSVKTHFRFIPNEDLPIFYQSADIIVCPYKDISQSGVLLTGMAFGKPIVATAVEGFKETIRNGYNGLLVEYGDTQGLADALIHLIQLPEDRNKFGKANLAELDLKYSWDIIAQKTMDCYRAVLEERPPA